MMRDLSSQSQASINGRREVPYCKASQWRMYAAGRKAKGSKGKEEDDSSFLPLSLSLVLSLL
jgi:hypothetical protein